MNSPKGFLFYSNVVRFIVFGTGLIKNKFEPMEENIEPMEEGAERINQRC
jgi:hypothetical protein